MGLDSTSIDDVLYPKIEPYATGMLPVSERHTIAWECAGNPEGIPVIAVSYTHLTLPTILLV